MTKRSVTPEGERVRNGVCLLCGSAVLISGEHVRDDLPPCYGRYISPGSERCLICDRWAVTCRCSPDLRRRVEEIHSSPGPEHDWTVDEMREEHAYTHDPPHRRVDSSQVIGT